jgi:hypothetical protein
MTKGAIFTLTLVVLTTTIIVLMVIFKTGSEYMNSTGLSVNSQGIVVNKEYKACNIDSDCTMVPIRCDSCECGGDAINRKYSGEARELYQNVCKGYQGGVCDINCPAYEVKCVNNLCTQSFTGVDLPKPTS